MPFFQRRAKPSQSAPQINPAALPFHVAFIMDGNGRWATSRGLPRSAGHSAGARTFRRIVEDCRDIGVNTVTVYALSTENRLSRPGDEIGAIMKLLDQYLDEVFDPKSGVNAHVRFVGDLAPVSGELKERIRLAEIETAHFDITLNICFNYGGRAELAAAFSALARQGKTDITEADISQALWTAHSPDPDLIIRTGNETRLSNFLLWQAAYSELWFTPTLWPDFKKDELLRAIADYQTRRRKYGNV